MLEHAYAVIMAGGRGERFWPLSTRRRPKQFLSLIGGKSLITAAVDGLSGLLPPERVLIITSADMVPATRDAVPALPAANIIAEPFGRDTAAAVALGAVVVGARDPQGVFCVLTADQVIGQLDLYRRTLAESLALAALEPVLVTIGIQPAFPSTGFGYIEAGEPMRQASGIEFLRASRFVEKPDRATADQYVKSGRYFWNSGMFVWSVEAILGAFRLHRPALSAMAERLVPAVEQPGFAEALRREYEQLERISIDYAVMEKAGNIAMAKGTFEWDDVGSWPAIASYFDPDESGNIRIGDCAALDSTGNIVVSNGRLTALIGVKDLIVVQADGVTLVCPKDRAQDIKKLVEQLRREPRYEPLL